MKQSSSFPSWLVPAGLVLLSLIPVLAGAARLTSLAAGVEVTAQNARFHAMPWPVVVHIVGATLFCLLGAFQFAPKFRSRRPGWHRVAGRVALAGGLLAAASGLWMTLYYPLHEQALQGSLLFGVRLVVGTAMLGFLVLALVTILRRQVADHRAWMLRAYALGQGAGTQALFMLPWMLAFGTPNEATYDVLMTLSWLFNVALAEWRIARGRLGSTGHRVPPSSLPVPEASPEGNDPRGL